jgi:hypothetical protein
MSYKFNSSRIEATASFVLVAESFGLQNGGICQRVRAEARRGCIRTSQWLRANPHAYLPASYTDNMLVSCGVVENTQWRCVEG